MRDVVRSVVGCAVRSVLVCAFCLMTPSLVALASATRPTVAPPPLLPAEPAWLTTLDGPPSTGGAIDGDRIYIPLETGKIAALDRATGGAAWTADVATRWPPLVRDQQLYAAASEAIVALDARTGAILWTSPMGRSINGPIGLSGELIVVPLSPDGIAAVSRRDGAMVWQRAMGGDAQSLALAIAAESVYVSIPDGRVVALSLNDGRVKWDRALAGRLTPPVAARDRVFVGSTENVLYALDDQRGTIAWQWRTGGDVVGAVADDDRVYVVSLDNMVRALNRGNGNQQWKHAIGTRPAQPPRLLNGAILVVGMMPVLSTFAVETGAPIGTYALPDQNGRQNDARAEALVDPLLRPFGVAAAIVTRDGRVIGLRPTAMMFRDAPQVPLSTLPGRVLPRDRPAVPHPES